MQVNIRETLYNLYEEFMAECAWRAHAYGFENMQEYYEILREYLRVQRMDTAKIDEAYRLASQEFEAICHDENRSFMDPQTARYLEKLDEDFLKMLTNQLLTALLSTRARRLSVTLSIL